MVIIEHGGARVDLGIDVPVAGQEAQLDHNLDAYYRSESFTITAGVTAML